MAKTPAIAAAERAGVRFSVHEYDHDPGAAYGLEAAEKLGLDPARVFKTLVASIDGKLVVAIVPVAAQLDLRSLGKRAALAEPGRRRARDGLRRRRDQPTRPAQATADDPRRVGARARDDPRQRRPPGPGDRARAAGPRRADRRRDPAGRALGAPPEATRRSRRRADQHDALLPGALAVVDDERPDDGGDQQRDREQRREDERQVRREERGSRRPGPASARARSAATS